MNDLNKYEDLGMEKQEFKQYRIEGPKNCLAFITDHKTCETLYNLFGVDDEQREAWGHGSIWVYYSILIDGEGVLSTDSNFSKNRVMVSVSRKKLNFDTDDLKWYADGYFFSEDGAYETVFNNFRTNDRKHSSYVYPAMIVKSILKTHLKNNSDEGI